MAIQRVISIPRQAARIGLSRMVLEAGLTDTTAVVDFFIHRFMRVSPSTDVRETLVDFLDSELGTSDVAVAETYMEDSLRTGPCT